MSFLGNIANGKKTFMHYTRNRKRGRCQGLSSLSMDIANNPCHLCMGIAKCLSPTMFMPLTNVPELTLKLIEIKLNKKFLHT